ncbi:hypothetical protein LQ567_06145 [Niabella pedocola]|uniref:MORN repeat variant n=1 Tax=Niabella pedocola TaxID=1752077 RepID=A0ABS8PML6_9BACT|nr:hypothetical protein [Niabella pedocola]MCD2422336.1 hypothetical protein [Niabella pedocola]
MKEPLLFALIMLLLTTTKARGQDSLPDNFTIGDFMEIYHSDSIKISFSCFGGISTKRCADYYRVGKLDPLYLNVTGRFHDYFMNGKVYLDATAKDGSLTGPAKYYYSNGQLKEEGQYKDGIRIGTWRFYYPTGIPQKVYFYEDGVPLVMEAFTEDNKQVVKNGNGHFKTEFSNRSACIKFKTEGDLINGKRSGLWSFSNINAMKPISEELYNDGIYIQSRADNTDYIEAPNTGLSVYYGNEILQLIASSISCPGDYSSSVRDAFSLSAFTTSLQATFDTCSLISKNQWLLVGLKIGTRRDLLSLNVASSINDKILEKYIYTAIMNIRKWKPSFIKDKKIEADFFFSVLVDNNKILIPEDVIRKTFHKPLRLKYPSPSQTAHP